MPVLRPGTTCVATLSPAPPANFHQLCLSVAPAAGLQQPSLGGRKKLTAKSLSRPPTANTQRWGVIEIATELERIPRICIVQIAFGTGESRRQERYTSVRHALAPVRGYSCRRWTSQLVCQRVRSMSGCPIPRTNGLCLPRSLDRIYPYPAGRKTAE